MKENPQVRRSSVQDIQGLWAQFEDELSSVEDLESLAEIRDKYLSRQRGLVTLRLRQLGDLPKQERPVAGQELNQLKNRIDEALKVRRQGLEAQSLSHRFSEEDIDVTLPGYQFPVGGLHPLRQLQLRMEEIFRCMGFQVVSGPEIESDYYNFEALNIPRAHPARDEQDSFYLDDDTLLRTHTSPVQIRIMETQEPPIRIIVPGRVYRRDAVDATHSPMFHQMEGLVVDQGISMAHLKGTLEIFFRELFTRQIEVRLRPSFFPFVEPGAEVDITCIFCLGDGCRVCKQSGWMEILGAGMVHSRILKRVGYDPDRYTGFAWGMGIDRIALTMYRVPDLRLFFENDIRFLRQFAS